MMRAAALVFFAACSAAPCPRDLPATCPSPAPSYATDIAPIVQKACASCHDTGGVAASTPLTTYRELASAHGEVLDQVYGCQMPEAPYTLTLGERVALLGWLVCEAPDN